MVTMYRRRHPQRLQPPVQPRTHSPRRARGDARPVTAFATKARSTRLKATASAAAPLLLALLVALQSSELIGLSWALTPAEEKQLLLDFKAERSYNSTGRLSTWSADTEMCGSWDGISSCTEEGNVKILSLSDNELTGTLPPQWSALTVGLTQLLLYNNQLTGALPPQWSTLTGLAGMSLRDNRLTGAIPLQWSALTGLLFMSLHKNQLTGALPPQWSALTGLTRMSLRDNQLRGAIPLQWSALTGLTEMSLRDNQLTGTLPPQWSALTGLTRMYLYNNQLTGTIPPQWSALTGLTRMSVRNNSLTGGVPAVLKTTGSITYAPQRDSPPSPPSPPPPPSPPLSPPSPPSPTSSQPLPIPWWLEWYSVTSFSIGAGIVGASLLLVGSQRHLSIKIFILAVLSCADICSDILSAIEMAWNWQNNLFWSASYLLVASSFLSFCIFNFLGTFGFVYEDNKLHQSFARGLRSLIELPWVIPHKIKQSVDSDANFALGAFLVSFSFVFTALAACTSVTVFLLGALVVVLVWSTMIALESDIITRIFVSSEAMGKLLVFVRLVEDIGETIIQVIYGTRVGFTGATIASLAFATSQIMGLGLELLYRILRGTKVHDDPDPSLDHHADCADMFSAGGSVVMKAAANAWSADSGGRSQAVLA